MALLMTSAAFAQADVKAPDTNGYPALKDAVILIIRHAEKTASGDELSPRVTNGRTRMSIISRIIRWMGSR
jgi:hypothetical protein